LIRSNWKHTLLTGGLALFILSGSAVSAMGRPTDPILLQPIWSPLAFQSEYLAKWKSEFSALQTASFAPKAMTNPTASAEPLLAAVAAQTPAPETLLSIATNQAAAVGGQQPDAVSQPEPAAEEAQVKKAAPAAAKAAPAEKPGTIATVTGATITPKKTIAAVASAYTGSAAENGGYAGKDYYGNPLQVGTIAVDPKMIPLGSTVYVTGYSYDGLPVGGMMAQASDIGGAIKGNRIDIYVPGSREKAKTFGYQNVTIHVVD
jgi:3D (Asp-Asp-Asp) domain-containing protein